MITFKDYNNVVSEQVPGWAEAGWEVLKFLEPTGIASIPDLITTFNDWMGDRNSPLKITFLILSILSVLPVAKYVGKSASKSLRLAINNLAKGGKADEAAKALAKANEEVSKVASELAEKFDSAKFKAAIEKVPMIPQNVKQAMYSNSDDLFNKINSFAKAPNLLTTKELGTAVLSGPLQAYKTMSKGQKGAMYAARGIKAGSEAVKAGVTAVNKSIADQKGQTGSTGPITAPGEEVVTYTDPKTGKQIQTTRQALKDAGIAPLEEPYPSMATPAAVPSFMGRQLTPAQAQALGVFATPYIPGPQGRPGTVSPQNIPQGATQENPVGREGMAPQDYMRPDRFNNPPNFFNRPQTYNYGTQQQYNPYDQYGGQQYDGGQPNPMAMVSGMISGGMSGSPAQGLIGLASGLMGLLPGIGGGAGINPMGMLPGLMGGI